MGLGVVGHYWSRHRFREQHDGLMALLIFGYVAAWVAWLLVGFNLARAKGYSRDFTGSLFVGVYILAICFPPLLIAFPLYILFGLEDKAKDWSRRHRQHS
jgi:hypothetical protein